MFWRRLIWLCLLLTLLADLGYSGWYYYNTPIDGDIPEELFNDSTFKSLRDDPLGLKAVLNSEPHANPNRYIGHSAVRTYFLHAPEVFKGFRDSLTSIYLSAALIKLITHVFFIWVLTSLVTGGISFRKNSHLALLVLSSVLLQSSGGFYHYLGFIDKSVTYVFYYGLAFLIIPYLVLNMKRFLDSSKKKYLIVSIGLTFILPFLGPLNSPVVLVGLFSSVVFWILCYKGEALRNFKVKRELPLLVLFLSALCLYSLFLERYNTLNQVSLVSVQDRYLRLFDGLRGLFTTKICFSFLTLSGVILQFILQRKGFRTPQWVKVLWLFCLVYVFALPLGGYKVSRPLIVRYDTLIPVFFCLSLILIYSIHQLYEQSRFGFLLSFTALIAVFGFSEKPDFNASKCQKEQVKLLVESTDKIVGLPSTCHLMTWDYSSDPDVSNYTIDFLHHHEIVDKEKRFYYLPNEE